MRPQADRLYEFGPFRINAMKRILLRDGEVVPLTAKVFDTLLMLVEHSGEILQKDQMMSALWPDTIVEENNLTQHISMLRKTLGERANEHRFVVTIPGRGYSFVADVRELHETNTELIVQQHTRSSITIDLDDGTDEDSAAPTFPRSRQLQVSVSPSGIRRRRMIAAAVTASLFLVALFAYFTYGRYAQQLQPKNVTVANKSIAILPFKSLNATSETDFLGSGMTDTLIAKLSNIQQIAVRPTSAIIKYAGTTPDTLAAGRELGVDSILEGTIQRSGDRVRVTVQLLGVRDGKPLWAQSFDERLTDIFKVQDIISEQVVEAILPQLNGPERERLKKRYTDNVEAYQAYLRGRYFWNKRNEDGLTRSVFYFHEAVESDPAYALAFAGMADAYGLLAYYGFAAPAGQDNFAKAKAAALRALEIDDTLAEAHSSLALIKVFYEHDNSGAEREFRRAIELNPNYATARQWYSDYLAMTDRPEEAMDEIKRAQEIDPLSPIINTTLGERLLYARQYDGAISQLVKTLEIEPDFFLARLFLGLAYEQKRRYAEAIEELTKANRLSGGRVPTLAALGHTYAVAGRKSEARKVLDELMKNHPNAYYEIATIYAGLGEKQHALGWLQSHHKKETIGMLKTDPRLDGLRSDPRFQSLLRA